MSAQRELFVYYRVDVQRWREAAEAVMAWQRELRLAHRSLHARVLRRPEATHGVTLMETYAGADTADDALEAELVHGAPVLREWLIGERHVERFDALD